MSAPAAFVLAAGLGTRLRPLTNHLPKPLVPIFHKPLLTFALDSLIAAGAGALSLNTHHLPESFASAFGKNPLYRDRPLSLFHEPLLLDTGGGIRNARSALNESTFFLYNGDILADLPLKDLLVHHRTSGALATLLLRPGGGARANVRFDEHSGRVLDIRAALGLEEGEKTVYSGIALFEPEIFDWIPEDGPFSIIEALLSAMRSGEKVAGLMSRTGLWIDIGTPAAYLEVHRLLSDPRLRPSYLKEEGWPCAIHGESSVAASASLEGTVAIGPGAVIGEGAFLSDAILWPGAVIEPEARIEGCIVCETQPVGGQHKGVVL